MTSSYLIVVCKTLGIGVLMFLDWSGAERRGGGMGGIVFRVQGIGGATGVGYSCGVREGSLGRGVEERRRVGLRTGRGGERVTSGWGGRVG